MAYLFYQKRCENSVDILFNTALGIGIFARFQPTGKFSRKEDLKMQKLIKRNSNNVVSSTIEAYSSCNSGCAVKDVPCICTSTTPTTGTTTTVAAQGATGGC